MTTPVVIVGGGPAGLAVSAAWPGGTRLLEAGPAIGGLCRSVTFAGAVFDLGGHSFHTPHDEVRALVDDVMAGNWATQRRDARVWFNGALMDYPFQSHIDQIADAAIRAECLADPGTPDPAGSGDFASWIVARFGAGIARHFMLPYNRKLWGGDLSRLAVDWTGERVAGAAGKAGPVRRPLVADSRIGYPASGGFETIFTTLARRCGPIECNARVVAIDPARRSLATADGRRIDWRHLVSTMPVPELLRIIEGCPDELIALADRLAAVHLKVVMLALPGPVGDAPQRVYVADPAMPSHKVAFNHTSSPALRALPTHAVMAEVSRPAGGWSVSDEALARTCAQWLGDAGLLPGGVDPIAWRVADLPYGYPIPTHDRPAIMAAVRQWLAPLGITTIGRFGGWDYWNSDRCLAEGLALGRSLAAQGDGR